MQLTKVIYKSMEFQSRSRNAELQLQIVSGGAGLLQQCQILDSNGMYVICVNVLLFEAENSKGKSHIGQRLAVEPLPFK
jgi:hypothetical protein